MKNRLQFYSVREVADILRISVRQVFRFIAAGDLRVHKFRNSIRISNEDLDEFLSSNQR